MAGSPGSKKGKALPDRFELPKACLAAPAVGPAAFGLPDKLTKRVLQHEYEALNSERNLAAAESEALPPHGRRFDAAYDYLHRLEEAKDAYDDWKPPNKPAFRETLTSLDNPLRTPANDPSNLPFYTTRGGGPVQTEQAQAPRGRRCFPRNERYGTMEQLAAGSLLPLSGAELRQARQEARLQHAAAGGSADRGTQGQQHSQEEDDQEAWEDTTAGPDQEGATTASLEVENSGQQGPQRQAVASKDKAPGQRPRQQLQDCSLFPMRDTSEAQRVKLDVTMQQAARLAEAQSLEEKLLNEWPHGVPKHVLLKLQREQQLDAAHVPTVGFGLPLALGSKQAAACLRNP